MREREREREFSNATGADYWLVGVVISGWSTPGALKPETLL